MRSPPDTTALHVLHRTIRYDATARVLTTAPLAPPNVRRVR
jgi:hypothetical protein